jgi:hypothetical protein
MWKFYLSKNVTPKNVKNNNTEILTFINVEFIFV